MISILTFEIGIQFFDLKNCNIATLFQLFIEFVSFLLFVSHPCQIFIIIFSINLLELVFKDFTRCICLFRCVVWLFNTLRIIFDLWEEGDLTTVAEIRILVCFVLLKIKGITIGWVLVWADVHVFWSTIVGRKSSIIVGMSSISRRDTLISSLYNWWQK